jgi:hypothetical protein
MMAASSSSGASIQTGEALRVQWRRDDDASLPVPFGGEHVAVGDLHARHLPSQRLGHALVDLGPSGGRLRGRVGHATQQVAALVGEHDDAVGIGHADDAAPGVCQQPVEYVDVLLDDGHAERTAVAFHAVREVDAGHATHPPEQELRRLPRLHRLGEVFPIAQTGDARRR